MNRQLPGEQIEAYLRDTARALPYPPTPDIAGAVWQRLVTQGAPAIPHRQRPRTRRTLAAMGLSLALMLAVVLIVPEARTLVGSILHVDTNNFVAATSTPTPTHTSTRIPTRTFTRTVHYGPTFTPGPTSQLLSTMPGSMTLDEARGKLAFPIRLPSYPSNLGEPDGVFVQDLDGPTLIVLWISPGSEEKVSVILYEMPADDERIKTKDDSLYMQVASVNSREAQWVRGPYVIDSDDKQGFTYTVAQRLVGGNMLAWSENGVAYRLESNYSLPESAHIAQSLGASP
jgi:hypothetical protein